MKDEGARQSGLTLIEVLVVIAALAVLFGVTALALRGLTERATVSARSAEYDTVQSAIDIYTSGPAPSAIISVTTPSDPFVVAADTFGRYLIRSTRFLYTWGDSGDNLRLAMTGVPTGTSTVTELDLVGWWPMNEGSGTTTADLSGHGNDGALVGAYWAFGVIGSGGLAFGGSSGRVEIPDSNSLDITRTLSLETWLFSTCNTGKYRGLITKFGFTSARAYQLALDGQNHVAFHLSDNGGDLSHEFVLYSTPYTVPVNTWVHVAATYDGAVMRLYVNGAEKANKIYAGGIAATTARLALGASDEGSGQYFCGVLDEPRVYARVLTAAEILQHYQAVQGATKSLTLLGPNGGETFNPGSVAAIRWNSGGPINAVRLEYSKDNSAWLTISAAAPNTGRYVWDVPLDPSASVRVRVSDSSDATVWSQSAASFTILGSPASPVARWAMDEGSGFTVSDATGHGHTGASMTGTVSLTDTVWVAGHAGSALALTSGNQYVRVPDDGALDIQDNLTLEGWISSTQSASGFQPIIAKFTFGAVNQRAYQLTLNSGKLWFHLSSDGTQTNEVKLGGGSIASDVWTHVAATYDGATMRLYVNGVQVASQDHTDQIAPTTANLLLGSNSDGKSGQNYYGGLDELAVYDQALSATTILAHAGQ